MVPEHVNGVVLAVCIRLLKVPLCIGLRLRLRLRLGQNLRLHPLVGRGRHIQLLDGMPGGVLVQRDQAAEAKHVIGERADGHAAGEAGPVVVREEGDRGGVGAAAGFRVEVDRERVQTRDAVGAGGECFEHFGARARAPEEFFDG